MLIKNLNLASSNLIIGEESVEFDDQGIAEIGSELANELLKLKGYELVDVIKEDASDIAYESLSNNELKDLIKEKGEKIPSGANKADLVEILNKSEK